MIGAHQPQNKSRAWFITILRWVAALAVLAILFHFLPVAPLRAALARVPPIRFAIILVLYLCAHTVGIFKWRMVVNTAGSRLDLSTSAQSYLGGLFGTLFLPSIIGGDVVRLAVGLRRSPRPAAVLAGNIVDRFLDVAAQATLVLLGLILLPGSLPEQFAAIARKLLLVCFAIVAAALLLLIFLWRPLLGGRSRRFRRRMARFRHAFRSVRRAPQIVIFGWLLGVLIQGTFILLNALLAISCGLFLPFRVWLFAWPLAKLAALLPLTQGGMGIREAVLVALLLPFGAPSSLTLASGLIWEGVIISGGLLAGLTAFLLRKLENANER
jgi:glycosyltransferase 2 family protein